MIRVLVVDDHPIVRAGIVGLLEAELDFKVVAEVASADEALRLVASEALDVVLMDLRMPGLDAVEATRQIMRGSIALPAGAVTPRVLIFTTYEEDAQILAAIEAGASGYLIKAAPAEELLAGIRAMVAGQTVLSPSVAAQLVARQVSPDPVRLTPREREVLVLVAEGCSNPAIAKRLTIGESTVKTHLLHVYEKLSASGRTRAVTRAMELGLIP